MSKNKKHICGKEDFDIDDNDGIAYCVVCGKTKELTREEVENEILERIAKGESVRSILSSERKKYLPSRKTWCQWLLNDAELGNQYARAMELRAEHIFEEILQIADTPQIGQKTVEKATGIEITEGDMIEHRRLRVDARKWMLGKMQPKKYGDKLDVTTDGEKLPASTITVVIDGAALNKPILDEKDIKDE